MGAKDMNALEKQASEHKWFHAIDFGDFQSCGRFPEGQKQNQTLFPVFDLLSGLDLTGKRCLDVGTAHGLLSFGMKMKGADYVAATDIMPTISPPFAFAQKTLGLDIDYRANTPMSKIQNEFPAQSFDLVVCAGVLYHMLNPFEIFANLRKLVKLNGYLIVETAFEPNATEPIMYFNSEKCIVPDVYTYWVPSASAVAGMAKLAGLDIIATRIIHVPDRIAFLLKVVNPSEVGGRTNLTKKIHETGLQDPALDISNRSGNTSSLSFTGALGDRDLVVKDYQPDFPPHPNKLSNAYGKGVWLSKNKNL